MQVLKINSTNYNKQPSFKQWRREVTDATKKVIYRNDTCFFREENFFPMLTNFFSEKFKDIPKVNVYCYGCSDGSEVYTFIMRMLSLCKEKNPEKYFPIVAKDIDSFAIGKTKKNYYKITKKEKEYIEHFTNNQFDRFFNDPYKDFEAYINEPIYVKKELYENVIFSIGDILEDYKNIKPKNSIILARNFWPYIEDQQTRITFFKKLYKHLGSNSYFVIGDYDREGIAYKNGNIQAEITNAGFKKTELRNVYIKE